MDEEFKVFEKFTFKPSEPEDGEKKDEPAKVVDVKKEAGSDSDEEQKGKEDTSNKKKKLKRRMTVAQVKQIYAQSPMLLRCGMLLPRTPSWFFSRHTIILFPFSGIGLRREIDEGT